MDLPDQTSDERIPYTALVRGAATFILLGQKNPSTTAGEIAVLYALEPEKVRADIDRIVQVEQHKVGGVFQSQ